METGGSLTAPDSVRKLQTALHAKAKGTPDFRFYSPSDRMGELHSTGTSQSGLQGCRRACDQAAAPVAVPQAQGTGREVRAVPG